MGQVSPRSPTSFAVLHGLAAFLLLSISGLAARAEPPEDAEDAPTTPEAREAPEARPAPPADVPARPQAPEAQPAVTFIEHMGPETFPGRLRGLYGGSLWLEPDFQGLQWPQNTRTGLGVSASIWIDNGYESIKRESDQIPNSMMYFQQGRGVFRATPAYVHDSLFVQGQVELVGNLCQTANSVCASTGTFTTDDLWIRFGEWNRWDLKAGRFEAWEIYHLGMAMDPYTLERLGAGMFGVMSPSDPALEAPTLYGVTYLHDRPTDGFAVGDVAVHLYPTDYLRFELLGKLGNDNYRPQDTSTGGTPSNYLGGRPVAILDFGWFKLKVGGEYQKITPTTQVITPGTPSVKAPSPAQRIQKGLGGSVQFVIDPIVEFGVSAAVGQQNETDTLQQLPQNTYTVKSVGGFANVRLAPPFLLGLGVNYTAQTDSNLAANSTVNDFTSQLLGFVAIQYLLAGQLFIKADGAYAHAYLQPSDPTVAAWSNTMYTGRVRLLYLY